MKRCQAARRGVAPDNGITEPGSEPEEEIANRIPHRFQLPGHFPRPLMFQTVPDPGAVENAMVIV